MCVGVGWGVWVCVSAGGFCRAVLLLLLFAVLFCFLAATYAKYFSEINETKDELHNQFQTSPENNLRSTTKNSKRRAGLRAQHVNRLF